MITADSNDKPGRAAYVLRLVNSHRRSAAPGSPV